jgi:Zn-dependent protease with chaperone function
MGSREVAWAATVLVGAAVWVVCAWLLYRTSVPSLHLSGFDRHRFFSAHELSRAARFTRGADLIWLASVVAELAALVVLVRVLPQRAASIGLGRMGTAAIVGLVLISVLWGVSLPFGIAGLWWDHHWGLGPFDILSWLFEQRATLGGEAGYALATIVLVVGLAGRFGRRWILLAWPVFVGVTALFAFLSGYLGAAGTTPVQQPWLRAEIARLERVEHVRGTPVRVEDVRSVTSQANAFTVGMGPSTHVVLWNTFLDPRYSHREVAVVVAHELGHARSRHILKAVGWTALLTLPALWLLERATRRRGGLANPESVPLAALVLVAATLLAAPLENAVSRRYEAEADWRALNATRDPAAARQVFRSFGRVSLEQPDPPLWDYLWLENHPTPMQRIAMAEAWSGRR